MAIYKGMFTLMCLLFADSIGGFRISTRCGFGGRSCSLPQPTPTPTDAYYFGTQSLLCVLREPVLYGSSSRFPWTPWHRLIKYKDYVLEWGVNGYSINFNRSLSSQCPIKWEEEPAGRSSKSINEVDTFGRMYEYYNGGYELLTNNCHMFANDLSRFSTHDIRHVLCPTHHRVAQQYMPTSPAETLNAFKATYSHFKGLETTFRWTINNCHQYKLNLIRFMHDYCESMGARVTSTTEPPTTTLSVMDLARSMAR